MRMARISICLLTMAVGTPYFALGDFILHCFQGVTVLGGIPNVKLLRPDMVKLKHDWVGFPAVHAVMGGQILT